MQMLNLGYPQIKCLRKQNQAEPEGKKIHSGFIYK